MRLGIRVRAADAELAFARLEPALVAGAEEVDLGDEVEFAVYGDGVDEDTVRALGGSLVVDVRRSEIPDGWATAWQAHLAPVVAGGFTVRPPWLEGSVADLVIDPGPSFGAASHPTTRLCLEALASLPVSSLVDWGCGSGVLAIAAARLGFAPVAGIELDAAAAQVARRNAARNGVDVEIAVGDVTAAPVWAETVVANLTLPLLVAAAGGEPAPCRVLLASGVLAAHADEAVAAFAPLGFAERERRELDGWAAIRLERA
ncbi:MAG TPA: 50S ribosomal protein L11 methyltransferase [Solirubrobacter sp.]|nr:50S ribosomal protein L11 methyltransferase [Solirubrobacter sp.]